MRIVMHRTRFELKKFHAISHRLHAQALDRHIHRLERTARIANRLGNFFEIRHRLFARFRTTRFIKAQQQIHLLDSQPGKPTKEHLAEMKFRLQPTDFQFTDRPIASRMEIFDH